MTDTDRFNNAVGVGDRPEFQGGYRCKSVRATANEILGVSSGLPHAHSCPMWVRFGVGITTPIRFSRGHTLWEFWIISAGSLLRCSPPLGFWGGTRNQFDKAKSN